MQSFETLSIYLYGCRAGEQREAVSEAKPRFCVALLSARQEALARMEKLP